MRLRKMSRLCHYYQKVYKKMNKIWRKKKMSKMIWILTKKLIFCRNLEMIMQLVGQSGIIY